MLQVGKKLEKWSWSKASRKGSFAPSGKEVGGMRLEQSKLDKEDCSRRERCRKNEIGVKQAGKGGLLQSGKKLEKWSWSKASRKGRIAPSRKVVGEMELEQIKQEREFCSKRGRSRWNEIGANQAGNDDLLQLEIN